MKDENNRKLFEWLGGECWHEGFADGTILARCPKCGEFWTHTDRQPADWPNPDYSKESGFFALLSGLRSKGFEVECDSITEPFTGGWDVRLYLHNVLAISNAKAHADTLPEAFFLAALKAMTSEEKAD